MSVADYIKQLAGSLHREQQSLLPGASNVLRDLDEVENTLMEIGANLEPRFFDISLTARIETHPSRTTR